MRIEPSQQGMGLVEVIVALMILLLSAMATGRLQSTGMVSARSSSFHFSLDHLASEMLETLRANPIDANSGAFNFDLTNTDTTDTDNSAENADTDQSAAESGDDTNSDDSSTTLDARMLEWNTRIGQAIPSGAGSVNCSAGVCDVVVSWMEEIDGNFVRQFYRTRTRV